jgi:hypothetical protein
MKSIKTKIACFLGMLAMLLMSTTASAQMVEGKPTDEKVAQLLNTNDAKILKAHLAREGYGEAGLNEEGTNTLSNPKDASIPFNTIAVADFRNSAGNVVQLYSHEELDNGIPTIVTRAETDDIEYKVVGGRVVVQNKSVYDATKALTNLNKEIDFTKLWNCIKKHYKDCTDLNPCFNCLKACFNNNKKVWKKLWCSLGCTSCYKCVFGIAKVFWCYFS